MWHCTLSHPSHYTNKSPLKWDHFEGKGSSSNHYFPAFSGKDPKLKQVFFVQPVCSYSQPIFQDVIFQWTCSFLRKVHLLTFILQFFSLVPCRLAEGHQRPWWRSWHNVPTLHYMRLKICKLEAIDLSIPVLNILNSSWNFENTTSQTYTANIWSHISTASPPGLLWRQVSDAIEVVHQPPSWTRHEIISPVIVWLIQLIWYRNIQDTYVKRWIV